MSERPNPLLKFIDLDGAIMSSETPSLKAIFDNLRNYPILALFYLVARDITHLPFPVATAFHYVLLAILLFLSIATFAQTAFLFTTLAMGLLFDHLPEKSRPVAKKYIWWFGLLFANFLFFCFFMAMSIFMVIQNVKING